MKPLNYSVILSIVSYMAAELLRCFAGVCVSVFIQEENAFSDLACFSNFHFLLILNCI